VSSSNGDCDDNDSTVFPTAIDNTVDGIDQNCDGFDGMDSDGDGFADAIGGGEDCNDGNPEINLLQLKNAMRLTTIVMDLSTKVF
jgi:hypothetical protein